MILKSRLTYLYHVQHSFLIIMHLSILIKILNHFRWKQLGDYDFIRITLAFELFNQIDQYVSKVFLFLWIICELALCIAHLHVDEQ